MADPTDPSAVTNGHQDARDDLLRELVALLQKCAGLPPDAVAQRVEEAVMVASEGRLRDDMAILAFGPTPQPKETDG